MQEQVKIRWRKSDLEKIENKMRQIGKTWKDFKGNEISYDEAKKILESQGFDVEIQDSVYNDTAAALSVLRQFPAADEIVKVNRTVS